MAKTFERFLAVYGIFNYLMSFGLTIKMQNMVEEGSPQLHLESWMSLIDDNTPINELAIPGAHAAQSNEDFDDLSTLDSSLRT